MRSQEQIKQQIKELEKLKTVVVPQTAFGNDNLSAIDAQIKALRELFDEDDCYDEWPIEEDSSAEEDEASRLRDVALAAVEWLEGRSDENLCDDWPKKK